MTIGISWGRSRRAKKCLRLPAGRAVADGNGFNGEFAAEVPDCLSGLLACFFGEKRKDGFVMQQFSLPIQADDLAAGPETRINGQHGFLSQRRRQQQLAQIVGKYLDGRFIGPFFGRQGGFPFPWTSDKRRL